MIDLRTEYELNHEHELDPFPYLFIILYIFHYYSILYIINLNTIYELSSYFILDVPSLL